MLKECIICYEPILYNKPHIIKNKVLYIKDCNCIYYYHNKCINKWLKNKEIKCLLCNKKFKNNKLKKRIININVVIFLKNIAKLILYMIFFHNLIGVYIFVYIKIREPKNNI